MLAATLAVDLGGTNLRCAIVTREGEIVAEQRARTESERGVNAVIDHIARLIDKVAATSNLAPNTPVGIAAPGPLDPEQGIVRFSPNLEGWINVPLRDELHKRTGRVIHLGNDANAATLGEYYFGAASGTRHLIYIALGTGFGGGVISDGLLIDGIHGLGGELGHICVNMDGPRCTCGASGCVEAYCSGWAIAREGLALVNSGRGQAILAAASHSNEIDARAVSNAAKAGDQGAQIILERAGLALGTALASFANILNPEMILIGGGLARIGDPLLNPARRSFRSQVLPAIGNEVTISESVLGTQTGIYGAAALVFYQGAYQ